ncbi:hypothetical protein [Nonlabens agnitus]|nr:hypothetical protein [Nonlabens agnitus]
MSKEKQPGIINRPPADMHDDGVHFNPKKLAVKKDKRTELPEKENES